MNLSLSEFANIKFQLPRTMLLKFNACKLACDDDIESILFDE